jgi:hypothetical protein
MNLTGSSTWKNARNRYIVGASGVALALSIAIGGISALPSLGSREASVTPQAQSRPATQFGTMSDAEFASANTVSAAPVSPYFDRPLSPVVGETIEGYSGLGQTREGVVSQYFDRPLSPVVGETLEGYFGLAHPSVVEQPLTPEAEARSGGYPIAQ